LDVATGRAAKELLDAGADIAGTVAGSAIGLVVGGVPGALIGAGSGPALVHTLRYVAAEVRARFLSPRETARVGAVLAFAGEAITARLIQGDTPRRDGFFDPKLAGGRTDAEEIFEGTLAVAQRAYEERKLPYLGRLFAGIAFEPRMTPAAANSLLRLIEELTYRQLQLLSLFDQNAKGNHFGLRHDLLGPSPGRTNEAPALGHEVFGLYQRELVWKHEPGQEDGAIIYGATDISPAFMETSPMGEVLVRYAGLRDMPNVELEELAAELHP